VIFEALLLFAVVRVADEAGYGERVSRIRDS
jgi:hypothetical protein